MKLNSQNYIALPFLILIIPLFFLLIIHTPGYAKNMGKEVLTGVYQCPGDFPGFFHSIKFTATNLGELSIETTFNNLDTGDCTPRGENARTLAQDLGCKVGPLNPFQRGGGLGGAFGFVCDDNGRNIREIIRDLSREILRPTE